GTYFDLQTAAIAAYLGDTDQVHRILRRASLRLPSQFAADGSQPEELRRRSTAHYCCFNLQGWFSLAMLADRYGLNLWESNDRSRSILATGAQWLLEFSCKPWPYEQIVPFDADRFDPLRVCAHLWESGGVESKVAAQNAKSRFDPHDG